MPTSSHSLEEEAQNVLVSKNPDEPDEPRQEETDHDDRNPLFVEVVLRKLFSLLNQHNLKMCRLVTPFWNQLSIMDLRKTCGIISFNSDNYWTNLTNHSIDDMVKFIDCVKKSDNFPFGRLDVGTSVIKEPAHEKILADFFRVVSPWITELTLRDEWGQQLFTQGLPPNLNFPCLEMLTVHIIQTISNDDDIRNNFDFVASIIETSSSLDTLVLVDHNGLDGKAVTLFINAIQKTKCRRIKNLYIAGQIEDQHLIQLSKMGLKLKKVVLDFWGSIISHQSLQTFLENQSRTLQELKIADFAMTSNFTVEFPRMHKLKTLMVKGSVLGRICISFPSISYVQQFPVLKRLSFSNAMDEWDEFLKFGIQPVETVEELKLPGDFSDENSLLHAARLFPNIKKLEVSALLNIANIVYDTMSTLEELILHTKYVDLIDDILTGLTVSECEEVKSFSDRPFRRVEAEHLNIITTKPLSSLPRLKILRLKCKRHSDPVEITDVSCRLVLLKMPSLQCVDFWGREPPTTRISAEVLEQMRKKFLVLC